MTGPTPLVRAAWATVLLVLGLLVAFFFVFNTLFTDGPKSPVDTEYLVAYLLVLVAYAIPAWAAGRYAPDPWWGNAIPLGLPGLAIVLLYQEPSWGLRIMVLAAGALGGAVGSVTGRRMRPVADA